MNTFSRLNSLFCVVITVCMVFAHVTVAVAQQDTLQPTDLRNDPTGYAAVVTKATAIAAPTANNPNTLNVPSTKVESKDLDFHFVASSASDRIAIFSDDGCTVKIAQTKFDQYGAYNPGSEQPWKVWLQNAGVGQALPNLEQSLHVLGL